jgi:hypothetical protein
LNKIRKRIVDLEELRKKTRDVAVLSQIGWQLAQQQGLREQRRQEIYETQNEKDNELQYHLSAIGNGVTLDEVLSWHLVGRKAEREISWSDRAVSILVTAGRAW